MVLAVLWLFKESGGRKRSKAADNARLAQRRAGSHCNVLPALLEVSSLHLQLQAVGCQPLRLFIFLGVYANNISQGSK